MGFINRSNALPSWWANTLVAVGGVPFNIYSWVATIQGWRCAWQGRIVEHGAWMYRLGCMWLITIVEFRCMMPLYSMLLGDEWGLALQFPGALLWVITLEIYLKKSGR